MKVLVIDDNPVDLKLAHALVQASGHHCLERSCAEKGLEAVRAYRPDVILLDLNLPGLDGIRFARVLQQYPDTRSIPIVAVTAYPYRYRLPDVLSAGCSTRIVKPINTRELVSQLQAVLPSGNRDELT
jgi:CheY-like chemotaxis protein